MLGRIQQTLTILRLRRFLNDNPDNINAISSKMKQKSKKPGILSIFCRFFFSFFSHALFPIPCICCMFFATCWTRTFFTNQRIFLIMAFLFAKFPLDSIKEIFFFNSLKLIIAQRDFDTKKGKHFLSNGNICALIVKFASNFQKMLFEVLNL